VNECKPLPTLRGTLAQRRVVHPRLVVILARHRHSRASNVYIYVRNNAYARCRIVPFLLAANAKVQGVVAHINLKAKFERSVTHFSFRRLVQGGFN